MSKKGGGKRPATPDAYATATQNNALDRLNTYGADGSGVRYGYTDPASGQFVMGTPPQGTQAAQQYVESGWDKAIRDAWSPATVELSRKMIAENITGLPGAARAKDTTEIAKALFDRNMSMMQPAIDRNNSRLLTNLQSRGIPIGSDAFNETYGAQQQQTQDTISRLAQDATLAAGNEQTRQYNIDNSIRGSALSEIAAALGGSYSPTSPLPSGSAPSAGYGSGVWDAYNAQMGVYNQRQQKRSQTASTLGGLAGSMLMKCTVEAKRVDGLLNTEWASQVAKRLPLAVWRYRDPSDGAGHHIGPMAEDFHAITGLGGAQTISVIDAVGVLFGALQQALLEIETLKSELRRDDEIAAAVKAVH